MKKPVIITHSRQGAPLMVLLFCGGLVLIAKLTFPHLDWVGVICSENGPVERMSAALWFMSFAWCLAAGWRSLLYRKEWFGLGTLWLVLGLRELDAHRWATGWNWDKLANFFHAEFPLWERLMVVTLVILPVVAVGLILGSAGWRQIARESYRNISWMRPFLVGSTLLAVCLVLDKIEISGLPWWPAETWQYVLMGVEEFGEFFLAAFVVSASWSYWVNELFDQSLSIRSGLSESGGTVKHPQRVMGS